MSNENRTGFDDQLDDYNIENIDNPDDSLVENDSGPRLSIKQEIIDRLYWLRNGFKYHKCPYCFYALKKSDNREVLSDTGLISHTNNYRTENLVSIIPRCANSNCNKDLPATIFSDKHRVLSVMGPKDSGKSYTFYSFLKLLYDPQNLLTSIGIHATIINKDGKKLLEKYETMAKQGGGIAGTTEKEEPILVRIRNTKKGSACIFTLNDIKGEDYGDVEKLLKDHAFLSQSDAVIFLIDPATVKGMAAEYNSDLKLVESRNETLQFESVTTSNYELIDNLTEVFKIKNQMNNGKISRPTAFALSKSDVIEDLYNLNLPRDKGGEFDDLEEALQEIEDLSSEMTDIFEEVDNRLLLKIKDSFSDFKIIPFSAIGDNPDKAKIKGINPKGLLLPFIYVLKRMDVI
jgi:hypothetical protein